MRGVEVLLVFFLEIFFAALLGLFGVVFEVIFKVLLGILLEILLFTCLWLIKRGCRRQRRLERKVVRKRKSEICPVKKIRRAGECGPVKPEGSTVASGRLRYPVSV